ASSKCLHRRTSRVGRRATRNARAAARVTMSQLKIREMPQEERPRENLAAHGASALSDAELVAILLRTGVTGKNVVDLARELLQKFGSFTELSRCSIDELKKIRGIKRDKALHLVAAFQLGQRLTRETLAKQKIDSPE